MIIPRTTIHLSIPRPALLIAHIRSWLLRRDPIALASVAIVALIVSSSALRSAFQLHSVPTPALAQLTTEPIIVFATARPVDRVAAAAPTAAPRLIIAYDQPNGSAFPDPIPEPAPSAWIGRWGDGWIEVQWQPNPVWIRAADLGANLADVRPVPQVQIAPVVSAPPPAPSYQVDSAPEQAPLPGITHPDAAQQAALDREFGLTAADMQQALDEHNAREDAWCAAHPENVNCIAVAKLAATATAQAAQP